MKARPDLKPSDSTVLSSPHDYYVDEYGQVNEIEDDEERILFGTVANPSVVLHTDPEELETRIACDPPTVEY